ncbi:MAG: HEAT repeat domain-containing protein [Planctomycetes bacterium]|nr:HEAT repeat domain-containing protein [Planctomycetota bacterium]
MSRYRTIPIAAVSLIVILTSCVDAPDHQRWGTKSDSLQPKPIATPILAVSPSETGEVRSDDLREAAVELLRQAMEQKDYPELRLNALEALQLAPEVFEPFVRQSLVDPNRAVRFAAAMSIGQLRMKHLAHLAEPLLHDPSQSVQAAAIYALHRCGHQVDLTPLAVMILSNKPEIRGNAAMVLGDLGDRSAAEMIRRAVRRPMPRIPLARVKLVNLQMAEALVKLGREEEMTVIRAALFAPNEQGEISALACMICGRLKDGQVIPDLNNLARGEDESKRPAEIRMAATWALAKIRSGLAQTSVPMEYLENELFQLRAQAASTLGVMGDPAVLPKLGALLQDPHPLVQIAAAGAILRLDQY